MSTITINGRTVVAVVRYVATYVNRDGLRTLMSPAQGLYTFDTPDDAQRWLDAVRLNTDAATIRQIWGPDAAHTFAVRPCDCWPGHFDPIGIYFDW